MTDGICVNSHRQDPDRPRPATDGLLCDGCSTRLLQQVRALPHLWDDLESVLAGPWSERVVDDPTALSIAENPLPLKPAVADHRSLIVDQLASWARMLAEDRAERPPVPDLGRISGWLADRHPWIVRQEWVDEYAHEVAALHGRAKALLEPLRVRFIPCGPCREHLVTPETGQPYQCAGTLQARMAQDPELRTDPTCDQCGTVVPIDHHAALRRGLAGLVDTQTAAQHLGVPASTIRRWGSEGRLKREGVDAEGRALWRLESLERIRDDLADPAPNVTPAVLARLVRRMA